MESNSLFNTTAAAVAPQAKDSAANNDNNKYYTNSNMPLIHRDQIQKSPIPSSGLSAPYNNAK